MLELEHLTFNPRVLTLLAALWVGCIEVNRPPSSDQGGSGGSSGSEGNHPGNPQGGEPSAAAAGSGESQAGTSSGTDPGGAGASPSGGDSGSDSPLGGATGGEASAGAPSGGETSDGGASNAVDGCELAVLDPRRSLEVLPLTGDTEAHDPSIIKADGVYYLFRTGRRIPVKKSEDLRAWEDAGSVFESNPSWIAESVPGAGDLWAPDISYFGGEYHLYYSASTFGSNRSCIGHATRAALDRGSWVDHGPMICSNSDGQTDDWNAIDPNLVLDQDGQPHLVFGSFWSGIKMIELDDSGARANDELHALAERGGNQSIEAPFIVRRCDFYYLFVSFDFCCRGTSSTYRTMVGRSRELTGPYLDREGVPLLDGGGTELLHGSTRWKGPGHNAVLFSGDNAYNVYHSYDAENAGRATLRIAELAWDEEGWPHSAGP